MQAPTITCWPLSTSSSVDLSLNENALPPKKADFSKSRTFNPLFFRVINEVSPDIPPPIIITSYFFDLMTKVISFLYQTKAKYISTYCF